MAKPVIDRLGFRLDPVRDKLIIEKLNELDDGARSYVARQALRHFFIDHNGGILSPPKPEEDIKKLVIKERYYPPVAMTPEQEQRYISVANNIKFGSPNLTPQSEDEAKYKIDSNILDPDEAELNAKLAALMNNMD